MRNTETVDGKLKGRCEDFQYAHARDNLEHGGWVKIVKKRFRLSHKTMGLASV